MMLHTYASSSEGNFFKVDDGYTRLMVECGFSIRQLQQLAGFQLAAFDACLITHEHKDHARAAKELLLRGMKLYLSPGTAEALELSGPGIHLMRHGDKRIIGSLRIMAFTVQHDAREPLGYLIHSIATNERLAFITDTAYVRYRFDHLTEIAVECNYSEDGFDESELPAVVRERIKNSHFSLERVLDFLAANDLRRVKQIHLLHLSKDRGDAPRFIERVQAATGIQTA